MAHFHTLTVRNIRRETDDCVSISFAVPETLADTFTFQPGQYLTVRTQLQGQEVRRSYSICTAPTEGDLRVAVKKIEGGVFSTFANEQLTIGDTLDVMPPVGHFHPENPKAAGQHYVFVAAGSGITPIISNLKTVLQQSTDSQCTLIYGNRRVRNIIFKEQIENLKNQYVGRLQVFYVLSREHTDAPLLHGRLTGEKIEDFLAKIPELVQADGFFACGPLDMSLAFRQALEKRGVPAERIHMELFNAPIASQNAAQHAAKAAAAHAYIRLDGLTLEVPVAAGQTLLDAALEAGADLPFACKGGVCCTCRAQVTEGSVQMLVNYALTEAEVARGFVLTCQSVPTTPTVRVDFDTK